MKHPVKRNRCACAFAIILFLVLVPVSFPRAQSESKRPGRLFAGMRAGFVPENVSIFSSDDCTRKEQLIDVFLGVRLRRYLALQSTFMYHGSFDAGCGESPPVPTMGPFTRSRREFGAGMGTYPYYSSEIDVIAEPLPAEWVVSLRLLAGYGWIWRKDIPLWLAGAGFAVGDERVRLVLDIKKYWFEVPNEAVTYHYQDGVLVDSHAVSQHTKEHPLAIVAGVEFGIPWLR